MITTEIKPERHVRLRKAGEVLAAITAAGCLTLTQGIAAHAGTDSGPINCGANIVAVRGEQQLYGDRLTLKVNTQVVYNEKNVYWVTRSSTLTGNRTWSGTSDSLYYAGTYGMCLPPGS